MISSQIDVVYDQKSSYRLFLHVDTKFKTGGNFFSSRGHFSVENSTGSIRHHLPYSNGVRCGETSAFFSGYKVLGRVSRGPWSRDNIITSNRWHVHVCSLAIHFAVESHKFESPICEIQQRQQDYQYFLSSIKASCFYSSWLVEDSFYSDRITDTVLAGSLLARILAFSISIPRA
jgi:hypothetical protein